MYLDPSHRLDILADLTVPGQMLELYLSLWRGEEIDFHPRQRVEMRLRTDETRFVQPAEWCDIPYATVGFAVYETPDTPEPLFVIELAAPLGSTVVIDRLGFNFND